MCNCAVLSINSQHELRILLINTNCTVCVTLQFKVQIQRFEVKSFISVAAQF